ncbi:DUF3616 domain-containing protein [bacterium]|nr:DUF3616 domain-containing protein [bacterium]MBU1989637.1 DUF3616 domain-containing protein [bacterium]
MMIENGIIKNATIENKKKEADKSKLTGTYFRNGLKSNLDLTTLADTKAGILISVNGFILTVVMTASGFVIQNAMMNIVFASIIVTALFSIVFAVFAIRPRSKDKLIRKMSVEEYSSLLFYGDMADLHPKDFLHETKKTVKSSKKSIIHLTTHLHILGLEIKKKYFWLKQAYTFFSIGLVVSVTLAVYGLIFIEQTPFNKISTGNISYKKGQFENIFEPSGVVQLPDGKVLIAEDESKAYLSIANIDSNGYLSEIGKLDMLKKTKNIFKNSIDDLEAMTNNGNTVYAITSHSTTSENRFDPSRNKLIRFEYKNERLENLLIYTHLKEDIFTHFPELFKASSFKANAFNIEGLSFDKDKGTLLVGLRSPLMKQEAILIEIKNPNEIFVDGVKPLFLEPLFLNLNNQGIRDMAYDEIKKGFWIVAGSSSDRDGSSFTLWFLDKQKKSTTEITNIPKIGFAEGISIVKNTRGQVKLLIVEDNGKKPNKVANYITIDKESL